MIVIINGCAYSLRPHLLQVQCMQTGLAFLSSRQLVGRWQFLSCLWECLRGRVSVLCTLHDVHVHVVLGGRGVGLLGIGFYCI